MGFLSATNRRDESHTSSSLSQRIKNRRKERNLRRRMNGLPPEDRNTGRNDNFFSAISYAGGGKFKPLITTTVDKSYGSGITKKRWGYRKLYNKNKVGPDFKKSGSSKDTTKETFETVESRLGAYGPDRKKEQLKEKNTYNPKQLFSETRKKKYRGLRALF